VQCRDAERVLRDSCGDACWEVGTAQVHQVLALILMARQREASTKLASYLREAEQRGDLWTYTSLLTLEALGPLLARGALSEAEARVAEAESRWQAGHGLHTARLLRTLATTSIALQRGDDDGGARLAAARAALCHGRRVSGPFSRIALLELSGRSSLVRALRRPDAVHLREVERCARRLLRERAAAATGFAQLLRSGLHVLRDERLEARHCLEQGIGVLEPLGLAQWSLPARVALGGLLGERGEVSAAAARAQLTRQGVDDVERFVATMLPASR
jgi:hypothetical protein